MPLIEQVAVTRVIVCGRTAQSRRRLAPILQERCVQHGPGYPAGSVMEPVVAAVQMWNENESMRLLCQIQKCLQAIDGVLPSQRNHTMFTSEFVEGGNAEMTVETITDHAVRSNGLQIKCDGRGGLSHRIVPRRAAT
jgi:hypothetical protein